MLSFSKPRDHPADLSLPPVPKSTSFSALPWDAPIQTARQKALASNEFQSVFTSLYYIV